MITASAVRRVRNCAASTVLARAENHSQWAKLGQQDHEELSDVADLEHEFAHLIPPGARSEVRLAYDVGTRTGRVIGEGAGREYGTPGAMEIVGSCDVLAVVDGVVVVLDWKTGFTDVAPAKENEQLWTYALAAARALGCDSARVVIVYTKTKRVDSYDIDPLELAEFANTLEWLYLEVVRRQVAHKAGDVQVAREGDWCKFCPCRHVCPAKNALLVQVASGGLATVGDATMTPARARGAYEQIVAAEQIIRDARARLNTYVDEQGPIDLGDGRAYGRYRRPGNESLDATTAEQAIYEIVNGEVAKEFVALAVERKVTKAGIKRAAEQLIAVGAPKVKMAIEKRIRELGGVDKRDTYPVGEYSTDKHEAAPADFPMDEVDAALKAVG